MRVEVYDLEDNLKALFVDLEEFTVNQSLGLPLIYKIVEDDLSYYPCERRYLPIIVLVCKNCGKAENEYPINKQQEACNHEYPTELL